MLPIALCCIVLFFTPNHFAKEAGGKATVSWPEATSQNRPWTFWWWPGSAVDPVGITQELTRFRDAGLGGVHIIPIYGVKGGESQEIEFLSPKWMEMLGHTLKEADRLGLGVDMTTGSGWCFGGPNVTAEDANASVVVRKVPWQGELIGERFDPGITLALMAFGKDGIVTDVREKLGQDGLLKWKGAPGTILYQVSQKPSGVTVKRAGHGGEGPMLNMIFPEAMGRYLARFTEAFAGHDAPKPRAMYQDSYESKSDWSPDFLGRFHALRGYRLEDHLPELFGNDAGDTVARVKGDYRETVSDLLLESTIRWTEWSRKHGFITRNQAHGSPGNLLDLYAAADVPETEMFGRLNPPTKGLSRNPLVSKFASSAAHVSGKNLVSAETGTWIAEHFQETLGDLKHLVDDLLLAGVNHVFYHGASYSPDSAPWPGWCFYAATEMNSRNSIWHDVPALNAYVTRCQSVLQSGRPDNDILLYWPIHDLWNDPEGLVKPLTVHDREWLEHQPLGKAAADLREHGYSFDYISDRQLTGVRATHGRGSASDLITGGNAYRTIVIPSCTLMSPSTLETLVRLASSGGSVIFEDHLPSDVPGLFDLPSRRKRLASLLEQIHPEGTRGLEEISLGSGRVLIGPLREALGRAGTSGEQLAEKGIHSVKRRLADGSLYYFVVNRGKETFDGWMPLSTPVRSAQIMDPMTGLTGETDLLDGKTSPKIRLRLEPGASLIIRAGTVSPTGKHSWSYATPTGTPMPIIGNWQVTFLQGGPVLPSSYQATGPGSWSEHGPETQSFAGTARYTVTFDAPGKTPGDYQIDLGGVCQSARIRLNARDLGTLISPPFRSGPVTLRAEGNLLEVEVTGTSANRIRDLDLRGVPWKVFKDINIVSIDYKPFDASRWPVAEEGLIGPVTLIPCTRETSTKDRK